MENRTKNIILAILKENKVGNIEVGISGFSYDPDTDKISLETIEFTVTGINEKQMTGLLNTIAELHAHNIYPKIKKITIM